MRKRHVYKNIGLWEGSSEHWKDLMNVIESLLENYYRIANQNDGLYVEYNFFKKLTQQEKVQLYLIGEQWLVTVHVCGCNNFIEGADFAYTLNEKGYLDR